MTELILCAIAAVALYFSFVAGKASGCEHEGRRWETTLISIRVPRGYDLPDGFRFGNWLRCPTPEDDKSVYGGGTKPVRLIVRARDGAALVADVHYSILGPRLMTMPDEFEKEFEEALACAEEAIERDREEQRKLTF